jgi:hypothetical protein
MLKQRSVCAEDNETNCAIPLDLSAQCDCARVRKVDEQLKPSLMLAGDWVLSQTGCLCLTMSPRPRMFQGFSTHVHHITLDGTAVVDKQRVWPRCLLYGTASSDSATDT